MKKLLLAISFVIILMSGDGLCGELRQYDPPSQRQYQFQQTAPQYQRTEDRTIYENFENEVRNLNRNQRDELINSFRQKRDMAVSSRCWDEAKHFDKLIDTLQKLNRR